MCYINPIIIIIIKKQSKNSFTLFWHFGTIFLMNQKTNVDATLHTSYKKLYQSWICSGVEHIFCPLWFTMLGIQLFTGCTLRFINQMYCTDSQVNLHGKVVRAFAFQSVEHYMKAMVRGTYSTFFKMETSISCHEFWAALDFVSLKMNSNLYELFNAIPATQYRKA